MPRHKSEAKDLLSLKEKPKSEAKDLLGLKEKPKLQTGTRLTVVLPSAPSDRAISNH